MAADSADDGDGTILARGGAVIGPTARDRARTRLPATAPHLPGLTRVPDFDPRTALVVADVQNDFADPAGSLAVDGAGAAMPAINAAIDDATEAGSLVVATQDWHPPSTPHFAKDGGVWPVHCVMDTWGAQFHPDLALPSATPVVRKGSNGEDGYSGFTMRDPTTGETVPTALEGLLREHGVESVVIVGLATDYCVSATALDAIKLGFGTEVLQDAIASVDLAAGDGERAKSAMLAAGCVLGYCFGTLP
jgi:nicotinamidase/pyrazinamidase